MAKPDKDWNYDRLYTVQAQIADVQNDMMRCLHKEEVNDVVRDRMIQRLLSCASDVRKLRLCHEE